MDQGGGSRASAVKYEQARHWGCPMSRTPQTLRCWAAMGDQAPDALRWAHAALCCRTCRLLGHKATQASATPTGSVAGYDHGDSLLTPAMSHGGACRPSHLPCAIADAQLHAGCRAAEQAMPHSLPTDLSRHVRRYACRRAVHMGKIEHEGKPPHSSVSATRVHLATSSRGQVQP